MGRGVTTATNHQDKTFDVLSSLFLFYLCIFSPC
jgi:hypothetical protein